MLHAIALARLALAEVCGWAVNSPIARLRLPQAHLACGPDRRAHRRLLGSVAAVCAAPGVAVLLVDRGGRRPFLTPRNGIPRVLKAAHRRRAADLPGLHHSQGRRRAQVRHLGQRAAVLVRRLQEVVQTSRHPAAIRRCRQARQHHRGRAVHRVPQGRGPRESAPIALSRNVSPARPLLRDLVRRTQAAHPSERPDTRRKALRSEAGPSFAAFRAAIQVAQGLAMRSAADIRQRQARRPARTRCHVRGRTQASAHRHAAARGLTTFGPAHRLEPWSPSAPMPTSGFQRVPGNPATHVAVALSGRHMLGKPRSLLAPHQADAKPNLDGLQHHWLMQAKPGGSW